MGSGILGYAIRRVLWAIPVLFLISIVVFVILRAAPTDPVDAILGRAQTPEAAERLRDKYGYDQPILVQYFKYMGNLFQGDPGISVKHQDFALTEVLLPKMWISLQMNAWALLITFAIGIPVGIYAALARGTFIDPLVIGSWLTIEAVPTFVSAPFFIWLFAIKWDLISLSYEGIYSLNMILPIALLSLGGVAGVGRFMRASMIGVMGEDYVRTARAKGLRESTVVLTHIARNAMLPMVTAVGLSIPGLVIGSLFIEQAFGIPGMGRESFQAALTPDYDVLMAITLITSTLLVFANVVIDLVYGAIDPRVRVGAGRGG